MGHQGILALPSGRGYWIGALNRTHLGAARVIRMDRHGWTGLNWSVSCELNLHALPRGRHSYSNLYPVVSCLSMRNFPLPAKWVRVRIVARLQTHEPPRSYSNEAASPWALDADVLAGGRPVLGLRGARPDGGL